MKQFLIAIVLLSPVATVWGQVEEAKKADKKPVRAAEAIALFEESAKIIKRIPAFSYDADYVGTDWVAQFVPKVTGKAVVGKESSFDIGRFKSDVTLELPKKEGEESAPPLVLSAGCDGDIYYLVDSKTKTVYADMDAVVMGSHSRDVQRIVLGALGATEPFEDELKADHVEIHGSREVGGEACVELLVTLEGDSKVMWFISKKDGLPRGIERFHKNREGVEASTRLLITNLLPIASPDAKLFGVRVPAGFKKTDDFAP